MSFQKRREKLRQTYPKRKEWWSRVFASPCAHFVLCLVADIKAVTPNRLTGLSFFLIMISAMLILMSAVLGGTPTKIIVAGLLIQVSYILDCMDGQLARYREASTQLGSFLDKSLDFVKFPILLFALMWEAFFRLQSTEIIIYAFLCLFFICFLFFLKLLAKSEFNIQEWDGWSGSGFVERNLRFFLFEEAQWYLIVSVGLVFQKGEWVLLILCVALGLKSMAYLGRIINILVQKSRK